MMRRLAALVTTLLLAAAAFAEVDAPPAPDAGRTTFETLCVNCHGPLGRGDGPAGRALLPVPRDFTVGQFKFDADGDGHTGTDDDLFLVIRDGAGPSGGNPLMAAWGHLGDEQVRELVAYVRSLEGAKAD
jgi:mono/diheme cytochrome c family protein